MQAVWGRKEVKLVRAKGLVKTETTIRSLCNPTGWKIRKEIVISEWREFKRLFNSVWHSEAAARASNIDFTITVANDIIHTHVSL